jgi:hypothetical protein
MTLGAPAATVGEPLALAHRDEVEALLVARWRACDPPELSLSDPWFANLFLFRTEHDWRWLRGIHPCIAGRAYDGARLLLPLFELQDAPVDVLRDLIQGHDAFGPLSDSQVARLDPAGFALSQARDDADYLYTADQFRHYSGTLLQKKRNLVKQLFAAHRVEAVPYTEALAAEATQVLAGWLDDKCKHPGESDDQPCREALALAATLGLDGWLYRIEGRPAGFVLAQRIRPGVAVMRFAKGLNAFKGLYQHMFQHYVASDPGVHWLNFEQDLGLVNFRRTKLSYQPVALLAKHRATLR